MATINNEEEAFLRKEGGIEMAQKGEDVIVEKGYVTPKESNEAGKAKSGLKADPAKKVIYDQAIAASLFWGIGNFCYTILDTHDFAVSCLQWPGYLLFSVVWRLNDMI